MFGTLHGIYSDPTSSQEARLNSLSVSRQFADEFTPTVQSELIDRHQEYFAKGDTPRHTASQQFFEKLGLLGLLGESERHALISNACKKLFSVHQSFDNFYNEPPFAERLAQLASQGAVPETVKPELVETIVTCAVGNPYGISRAAYSHYEKAIEAFTPAEIDLMLSLPKSKTIVGNRIRTHQRCKVAFKKLVSLIEPSSVPTRAKKVYADWIK